MLFKFIFSMLEKQKPGLSDSSYLKDLRFFLWIVSNGMIQHNLSMSVNSSGLIICNRDQMTRANKNPYSRVIS